MLSDKDAHNNRYIPAQRVADFILDVGTFLLASGAHCGRVNSNLMRFAVTWGFELDINPSFKGLLITVKDANNHDNAITCYKNSPSHNVHLAILTEVSHLSWKVQDDCLSIDEAEQLYEKIKKEKSYSNWAISIAVGLACGGLCLFSMGDMLNALVAMLGAFIGFFVRVKISQLKFNAMLSVGIAAFVTTLITGVGTLYDVGANPEAAMATAVLYLIPGVPLINSVIDLIDGYLTSAINRMMFAGFTLLCIAAGMTLCITLMGINNF